MTQSTLVKTDNFNDEEEMIVNGILRPIHKVDIFPTALLSTDKRGAYSVVLDTEINDKKYTRLISDSISVDSVERATLTAVLNGFRKLNLESDMFFIVSMYLGNTSVYDGLSKKLDIWSKSGFKDEENEMIENADLYKRIFGVLRDNSIMVNYFKASRATQDNLAISFDACKERLTDRKFTNICINKIKE